MQSINKIILTLFALLSMVLGLIFYLHEDEVDAGEGNFITNAVSTDRVKITFLDIGQGDATFIDFPDSSQMLVDCAIDARVIEALGRVMPYYDHEIDYLLITHPDLDHYGGCTEVLKRFDVKNIIYNGMKKEYDDMWVEFWQAIEDEGANYYEIDKEEIWSIASTTLHFLYPDHSIFEDSKIPGHDKDTGANNTSIVFKLIYGDSDILMTGDAEAELEEYLISTYSDQMDVKVLKVGHHSSGGASSQEFLDIVTPGHSVISCGINNSYGHPSRRTLKRLERASSTVWRTDLQGDIMMEMYKDNIIFGN